MTTQTRMTSDLWYSSCLILSSLVLQLQARSILASLSYDEHQLLTSYVKQYMMFSQHSGDILADSKLSSWNLFLLLWGSIGRVQARKRHGPIYACRCTGVQLDKNQDGWRRGKGGGRGQVCRRNWQAPPGEVTVAQQRHGWCRGKVGTIAHPQPLLRAPFTEMLCWRFSVWWGKSGIFVWNKVRHASYMLHFKCHPNRDIWRCVDLGFRPGAEWCW